MADEKVVCLYPGDKLKVQCILVEDKREIPGIDSVVAHLVANRLRKPGAGACGCPHHCILCHMPVYGDRFCVCGHQVCMSCYTIIEGTREVVGEAMK